MSIASPTLIRIAAPARAPVVLDRLGRAHTRADLARTLARLRLRQAARPDDPLLVQAVAVREALVRLLDALDGAPPQPETKGR